ncbi:MAG: hypothetical protein K9H64_08075 [Bacteroidales bacterium]|nr:hypothetical protein [Bacteroidales bacterium]MCF8455699.1 hypothetical protein [Bacteroidales bacterium]
MEEQENLIESLLERATEYGKISFELGKLKALDKTSKIGSSIIAHSLVSTFVVSFLLFFNLGIAFWLGEILGQTFIGFAVVAAFYGLIAIVIHLFFHKRIKKYVGDYIIKQVLK